MFEKRKIKKAFDLISAEATPSQLAAFAELLDRGVSPDAVWHHNDYGFFYKYFEYSLVERAIAKGAVLNFSYLLSKGARIDEQLFYDVVEKSPVSRLQAMFDDFLNEVEKRINGYEVGRPRNGKPVSLAAALEHYSVDKEKILCRAIRRGKVEFAKKFIDESVDLSKMTDGGFEAVRAAISSGDDKMLEYVLSFRLDLISGDNSALKWAIDHGRVSMLPQLLKAQADPALPIQDCETAEAYARKCFLKSVEACQGSRWSSPNNAYMECADILAKHRVDNLIEDITSKNEIKNNEWTLTAASEVTRRTAQPDMGYSRTEIFNFAGAYTQINRNVESGAESSAVMPIDSLRGTEMFCQAAQELLNLGGVMPENSAVLPAIAAKKRTAER